MQNPVAVITDKVMSMIKSMVYLAMRVSYRGGATTTEISRFLNNWAPSESNMYHEGIVGGLVEQLGFTPHSINEAHAAAEHRPR